ncbi:MAG: PEP-CTERM sorting domain-containing protein [Verrucomicrobia bacterium]|nr:PEP-CTERM sorting domain-containing protein [Verrucomicrobiota bacterium]
MKKISLVLLATISLAVSGRAAVSLVEFGESNLTAAIPDNNLGGMARSVEISGYELKAPYVVTVSMKIVGTGVGAFNGDYYAYLKHVSTDGTMIQLAVLLNRLGRSTDLPTGYSDNGLNIVLADSADEDIHNYRFALSGGNNNPITGQLTGTWQADGRNVDPLAVFDTSFRTTTLNSLGLVSPNGTWTLFVADAQAGGIGQLTDWKVTMQGVPEPSSASLLVAGMGGLWAWYRRRKKAD